MEKDESEQKYSQYSLCLERRLCYLLHEFMMIEMKISRRNKNIACQEQNECRVAVAIVVYYMNHTLSLPLRYRHITRETTAE